MCNSALFQKAANKIHVLDRVIAEAVGAKHGMRVIIKRMVPVCGDEDGVAAGGEEESVGVSAIAKSET